MLVPVDTFRAWQAELNELDILRDYKVKMDSLIGEWENKILSLEVALEQERRASEEEIARWVVAHDRADRRAKMPGLGLGVGYGSNGEFVGVVGLVWKPFW